MNIWKILTKTGNGDISQYCLDNGVAAMGWSLLKDEEKHIPEVPLEERKAIASFEDFNKYAINRYKKTGIDNVRRLAKDVKENDIIWLRCEGKYYFTRVTAESVWKFCAKQEAINKDASNQIINLDWIMVGNESQIPGAIRNALIGGGRSQTFCRIHADGVEEFSESMYDQISNDKFKYNRKIELTQSNFYSLISPEDCEDLLYSWLYATNKKNYMCIPSTNKTGTQKYEFVIIDTQTGKHIYCQVKNGNIDLDAEKFAYLTKNNKNDEVYLLTTRGVVKNIENYKNKIFDVSPTDLFNFACDEKNANYIPPSINFWMQFAGSRAIDGVKGIMIDTNTHEDEKYMLDNNVVAAWGNPKMYIEAFDKGDYALFYSKGKGIIAIGEIVTGKPEEIENGLQHKVNMIVDCKTDNKGKTISVPAKRIKGLLNKGFYFASTRKVPFLNEEEVRIIVDELKKKQEK